MKEMADPADFNRVREIARSSKSLLDSFDYTRSPEFGSSVSGKGDDFVEMKKRLLRQPTKKAEQRKRLGEAFIALPDTSELRALLPESCSAEIEGLATHVRALRNPD
jgi:hypothetical protein